MLSEAEATMNICMISYSFYENDNRVRRYAEALAARGDEVVALTLRKPKQVKKALINGVIVNRIQQRVPNEQNKLSYLIKMLSFFFRAMLILAYRHLRTPYQVLHVHSIPDFMVFAAWLPRLFGAKIILDIHNIINKFYV